MTVYIKARVQPLAIPVNVLLPSLCHWHQTAYRGTAKENKARKILEDYNSLLPDFNKRRGSNYKPLDLRSFYYWLRCNPVERLRTPYLDELLLLAEVAEDEDPRDLITAYINWVQDVFGPSLEILKNL